MKQIAWILTTGITIACSNGRQAVTTSNTGPDAATGTHSVAPAAVPPCIIRMIDSAKASKDGQGITEVRRYLYNGAKVYLVGAPCCDQFNPAYDSACNYLFAPSGGFTGKGDGSHPDFFTNAKEDSLIWRKK